MVSGICAAAVGGLPLAHLRVVVVHWRCGGQDWRCQWRTADMSCKGWQQPPQPPCNRPRAFCLAPMARTGGLDVQGSRDTLCTPPGCHGCRFSAGAGLHAPCERRQRQRQQRHRFGPQYPAGCPSSSELWGISQQPALDAEGAGVMRRHPGVANLVHHSIALLFLRRLRGSGGSSSLSGSVLRRCILSFNASIYSITSY